MNKKVFYELGPRRKNVRAFLRFDLWVDRLIAAGENPWRVRPYRNYRKGWKGRGNAFDTMRRRIRHKRENCDLPF